MIIYDITLPLSPELAVWPGDTPVSFRTITSIDGGDVVNLGSWTASMHAGSHADAPWHFNPNGLTIDQVPLNVFVGRALLVDLSGPDAINTEAIANLVPQGTQRLLIRTSGWSDHSVFPTDIPVMEEGVVEKLAELGVKLIGLDVPSVDPLDSKDLPNHHALGKHEIQILEGLDLSAPPPGAYQLVAMPMKFVGGDGAPVRAILISDE